MFRKKLLKCTILKRLYQVLFISFLKRLLPSLLKL